jgi:hypothetical protein
MPTAEQILNRTKPLGAALDSAGTAPDACLPRHPNGQAELSAELENWFRDRALDEDPSAGLFALAYAMVRLSGSIDGLTKSFAGGGGGLGTFDSDYFLIRLSRRLDELAKQLGAAPLAALAAHLLQQQGAGTDPPQAAEFLSRRRRAQRK